MSLHRIKAIVSVSVAGLGLAACGGATRTAPPQTPGTAALTAANVAARIERVLVAERGTVSMVARGGCVATIASKMEATGPSDEMRVRCPRPERLKQWFAALDKLTPSVEVQEIARHDESEIELPAAELVTASGAILRVKSSADIQRLLATVRAFSAELASAEVPSPGPRSPNGWQMLRVVGSAHVFLGGEPTAGTLEARVSTSGQYLCDFVANTDEGPMRVTKSGWITPANAAHAIDEVLQPFAEMSSGDRTASTFAAAVAEGSERRASVASTEAVFKRFATVQDALGDACLPELEAPADIGL
ncbi:MAG: hypothetical protein KF819_38935 [Labilithrix sp.]|nr:hypothetical protein [Labilithrix sp.]